jgi:hypothetical protein
MIVKPLTKLELLQVEYGSYNPTRFETSGSDEIEYRMSKDGAHAIKIINMGDMFKTDFNIEAVIEQFLKDGKQEIDRILSERKSET